MLPQSVDLVEGLKYPWIMLREFSHVKHDGSDGGWVMDGLIARPLPVRIRIGDGTP